MDTLFGLPAHPFLVHIPIVLLPLAAVGVILMVIKPAWHERYRWVVLAMGAVGTIGAVVAASAGEELEGRIISVEGREAAASWENHAELGDTARLFAIIFLVVLAAYVLIPWFLQRRASRSASTAGDEEATMPSRAKGLRMALAALTVVAAAASVFTVVDAGHTGSKSVWEDFVAKTSGG